MNLKQAFGRKRPAVSIEVFPPKMDTPIESIYDTLDKLAALRPDFFSVTYGAGGSKKDRTLEIASKIEQTYQIPALAHFTCVGHSVEEIDAMTERLQAQGLNNVLALRGDPPRDQPDFDFSRNAFRYASELISHLRQKSPDMTIAAAAYAEGHVDSPRISTDIDHLKHKVDCGVDFLVTQLFFDNRIFYDFSERIRAKGIHVPLAAGIIPVFKADQMKRMAQICGTAIPGKLVLLMDKFGGHDDDMRRAGIDYACQQIDDLKANGVEALHLMTMNRPKSTQEIIEACGLLKD